jgi:hypothetical protein
MGRQEALRSTTVARDRGRAKALPAPDPLALLLGRIGCGARETEWVRARNLGFEAVLDEQLAPQSIPDGGVELALAARLPTLALDVPGLVAYATDPARQFVPASELVAATLARQLLSPRQLFETMVEFWNNHFSVFLLDGPVRFFKSFEDRVAIRPHALGRFRDLLKASARSPAMLYYLDNYANAVGVANENYARELMELHALGAGGGYLESDVREVARAFTGWTINVRAGDGFAFTPLRHDFGAKTVLGQALPAGQGIADGEVVLDVLASHLSTARFISTKLARRFVADDPPPALVERMSTEFTATDGDIAAVLRVMFRSGEFAGSADMKFKRPVELVLSAVRVTGARVVGDYVRILSTQLATMGQVPFQWDPPDGYPDAKAYWLNTTALLNRWNFGFALAEGRFAPWIQIDEAALAGTARSSAELVDRLAARLLRRTLDPADRDALIVFAAGGVAPDAVLSKAAREQATIALVGALLASDYFQYR